MRTHKKITRHLLLRWSCGEREREISREKRTCVMDCVGWKESWIETESYCTSMLSSEKWGSWHPLSIISLAQSTKAPSSSTSFFSIWKQPSGYPILANCQGYFEEKRGRKKKKKAKTEGIYLIPIIPQWRAVVSPDFGKPSQKLLKVKGASGLTYSNLFVIYCRKKWNSIQEGEDNLFKEEKH